MKNAVVKWVDGFQFVAKADTGHSIVMDAGGVGTPENTAPTPVEMVIMALGSCTAIDVLNILIKKRLNIKSFEVKVGAETVDDMPKVFKEVWIKYIVHGNVTDSVLKKAIDLASEKYCSIGAMLKKSAKFNYEFEIIDDSLTPG